MRIDIKPDGTKEVHLYPGENFVGKIEDNVDTLRAHNADLRESLSDYILPEGVITEVFTIGERQIGVVIPSYAVDDDPQIFLLKKRPEVEVVVDGYRTGMAPRQYFEQLSGTRTRGWGEGLLRKRDTFIDWSNTRHADALKFQAEAQARMQELYPNTKYQNKDTSLRNVLATVFGFDPDGNVPDQISSEMRYLLEQYRAVKPQTQEAVLNLMSDAKVGLDALGRQVAQHSKGVAVAALVSTTLAAPNVVTSIFNSQDTTATVEAQTPRLKGVIPVSFQSEFELTMQSKQPLARIADTLGVPVAKIAELNPELDFANDPFIGKGQTIKVVSLSTLHTLSESTTPDQVAKTFGIPTEALIGANQKNINEHAGKLDGDVALPGVITLEIDGKPDLAAIANSTGVDLEQLTILNASAPIRTLVLPLHENKQFLDQALLSASELVVPIESTTTSTTATTVPAETTTTAVISPTSSNEPDVYASQRDNPAMGNRPDGRPIDSSNTCNMTSLTMALEELGLVDPSILAGRQPEEYVVDVYKDQVAPTGKDITDWNGIKKTAEALGAQAELGTVANTREYWESIRVRLEAGETAIVSISGHIVHIKEINDQGIVVDDPAGSSILLSQIDGQWTQPSNTNVHGKKHYTFGELNPKTGAEVNQKGLPGDNNLWPWADVDGFKNFRSIAVISNARVIEAPVPEAPTTTAAPAPAPEAPAPVPAGFIEEVSYGQLPEVAKERFEKQLPTILNSEEFYKSVQVESAKEGKPAVPWKLLAVIDYRENGNNPERSMLSGEKIGQANYDTGAVEGSDRFAVAMKVAARLQKAAERLNVTLSNDMSLDEVGTLLLDHNRGGMYKNAKDFIGTEMFKTESTYVVSDLKDDTVDMHFSNKGHYGAGKDWGEPESVHGKDDANLGGTVIWVGLSDYEKRVELTPASTGANIPVGAVIDLRSPTSNQETIDLRDASNNDITSIDLTERASNSQFEQRFGRVL